MPIRLKALKPKEIDFEPRSLGDHLRKRRLVLGLTQKQAAKRLEINAWTVLNWEKGHSEPPFESIPAIVQFLGYNPFPEPRTLRERLLAKRRLMGWSIRKAAQNLGVDPGTWGDWERGRVILYRKHRDLVARLLDLPEVEFDQEMEGRWIRSHE